MTDQKPLRKVDPGATLAVRTISVPAAMLDTQFGVDPKWPQSKRPPAPDIEPKPAPEIAIPTGYKMGSKLAETFLAPSIVIWHNPIPEQSPDQPTNSWPGSGVAVKVIVVPDNKDSSQSLPQSIPGKSDVTLPRPGPPRVTETG